ncbi:hypothetical protein V2G26_004486 [Clonostachys chloroleuca]
MVVTEAQIADAANFFQFPHNLSRIRSLQKAVDRFADCLENDFYSWDDQPGIFSELELDRVQRAYKLSSLSTSLFSHLAGNATCNAQHQAKLDLSGVREDHMKVVIRKCQETTSERWLPAVFTQSLEKPGLGIPAFNNICSLTENTKRLRVLFNSDAMWPPDEENTSNPLTVAPTLPSAEQSLEDCLDQGTLTDFSPKHRALAGFFLAATFFHLIGSPWLNEPFVARHISLDNPVSQPLDGWHVRARRSLERSTDAIDLAESVAALGVLILELETGFKSSWERDDEMSTTGEMSHHLRLSRLVREWSNALTEDIQRIARSCLEFNFLVDNLPGNSVTEGMRRPLIIYQHLLEPIFRRNGQSYVDLKDISAAIFATSSTLPHSATPYPPTSGNCLMRKTCPSLKGRWLNPKHSSTTPGTSSTK